MPPHSWGSLDYSAIEVTRSELLETEQFGLLRFRDAAKVWLAEHRREISEPTYKNYQHMLGPLTEVFGDCPLNEIDYALVLAYQNMRQQPRYDEQSRRTFRAGYSPINHECSMLAQVLARAGLWTKIARFYKPLKRPKSRAGCALEPEERAKLFRLAQSNPYWTVAYWCALITLNTTAGWGEIRHLHLSDIDLKRKMITVRDGLKNQYRERSIPLNDTAIEAFEVLLERAEKLGCNDPEHYLLPHRAHRRGESYDPNQPMGSCRTAWRSMRLKAGLPKVRMYDLRHDAITTLAEDPEASEQTLMQIAGHVTKKMLNHYSHIHMKPKREALQRAETKQPVPQLNLQFEAIATPRTERHKASSVKSHRGAKFSTGDLA